MFNSATLQYHYEVESNTQYGYRECTCWSCGRTKPTDETYAIDVPFFKNGKIAWKTLETCEACATETTVDSECQCDYCSETVPEYEAHSITVPYVDEQGRGSWRDRNICNACLEAARNA